MSEIYSSAGRIKKFYECPCQVKFVGSENYDYIEDNFNEVVSSLNFNPDDFNCENHIDVINFALMSGNYECGIAYEDKIICGCCGGVVELNEVYYLKEYKTWIDISNDIEGFDDEISF